LKKVDGFDAARLVRGFAEMGKKKGKAKTGAFVLDCSLTVSWFFEDETDAYAEAVEDSLPSVTAVVPSLWPLEVANALLVGERRERATEAKVTTFLTLLSSLPIKIDDETAIRAWTEALPLARAHQLSVYDAGYLELAVRLGLPLASLDEPLLAAAKHAGVVRFVP
jgi:predicted nucleic acid-binding protein